MTEQTTITLFDCFAEAFQAILRGDANERDKLCAMAERTFIAHGNVPLPGDTPILIGKAGTQ